MKTSRIVTAVAAAAMLILPVIATAKTTTSHGMHVKGSVSKVDASAKTFSVAHKPKDINLSWNDATKAPKDPLTVGEAVNVTYMAKDGQNVATVITATPAKTASATKTTTKTTTKAKS
jgi:glycine cleavage system regulatory protein